MAAYFVPLIFVGMFLFTTFLLYFYGWRFLTQAFPRTSFHGDRLKGKVSGKVNNVRYKGFIVFRYNNEGVRLATPWIFRIFHRPVFIPWNRISVFTETNFHGRVKFRMYVNDPDLDLYLTTDQTKTLQEYMNRENIMINRPFF